MSERQAYEQKLQAQLDEWKAEVDRLKAKAAAADAEAKLEINRRVQAAQSKIEEGRGKLAELAEANDEAWASIKTGVESAWTSLASGFRKAASKFEE